MTKVTEKLRPSSLLGTYHGNAVARLALGFGTLFAVTISGTLAIADGAASMPGYVTQSLFMRAVFQNSNAAILELPINLPNCMSRDRARRVIAIWNINSLSTKNNEGFSENDFCRFISVASRFEGPAQQTNNSRPLVLELNILDFSCVDFREKLFPIAEKPGAVQALQKLDADNIRTRTIFRATNPQMGAGTRQAVGSFHSSNSSIALDHKLSIRNSKLRR